jgi:uncharacterized protein
LIKQIEISIPPEQINNNEFIKLSVSTSLEIPINEIITLTPIRRSIDSRKTPVFRVLFNVYIGENPTDKNVDIDYQPVTDKKRAIIIGFGPGGMFAALRLIELGIKPIIIERGKNVRERRKDLKAIQQNHIVNPDSNYCFGEGGAGTFSDGKLYTRSVKRGNVKKILDIFIQHGADTEIRIDAHPHIGSNKLPKIVEAIRNTILDCGGEIYFNSRLTDIIVENDWVKGIVINQQDKIFADAVILATGHSARDVIQLLDKKKIKIESKPFAIGFRIEHPQPLINEIQYHTKFKNENLPAAAYNLSCNINERGVYSFCMCPGGIIVPAATSPGELVVNGMSLSRRDSPFANSGLVAEIKVSDLDKYYQSKQFPGLEFQSEIEKLSFKLANNSQSAPAQRATDFLNGKYSQTLSATSYIPGLTSSRLDKEFPHFLVEHIKTALKIFNKKMKGYVTEEAVLVAVESRTSSPIRIPRNSESFMHHEIQGLFPCGEGAGYAGGIVSAAIDGENCANAVCNFLN